MEEGGRVDLPAGLTLTVADTMVMLEPLASASDESQCRNRIHRIGQCRPVRCLTLFTRDCVDERLLVWRSLHDHRRHLRDAPRARRGGGETGARTQAGQAAGQRARGGGGSRGGAGRGKVGDAVGEEGEAVAIGAAGSGETREWHWSEEEEELCVLAHEHRGGDERRAMERLAFLVGASRGKETGGRDRGGGVGGAGGSHSDGLPDARDRREGGTGPSGSRRTRKREETESDASDAFDCDRDSSVPDDGAIGGRYDDDFEDWDE